MRLVPGPNYVMASSPSLHPNYQASQVLRDDPTPFQPFVFLVSSTCATYSIFRNWSLRPDQELERVSLVASMTSCETRTGLRPRASPSHSPCLCDRGCCLTRNRPLRQDPIAFFRGSIPFTAGHPAQAIRPRFLSVYTSTNLLPGMLQHSIPGLWLGVTRAGFPPACHQAISSSIPVKRATPRAANLVT